MAQSPKCRVGGCIRNEAGTILGEELPGPLQLCFAHTEQYRQNREGWKIDWAAGASEPTSVFAPDTWTAQLAAPAPAVPAGDPQVGRGVPARLRDWSRQRRATRGDPRG